MKDSSSFAEEVTNFDFSLFMASPDVESFFTNIPLTEIVSSCVEDLYNIKNLYSASLNKVDLLNLLQLATSGSSFIYDNSLYKQIDSVAMGSP